MPSQPTQMAGDFANLLTRPPDGWPCTRCGEPIDWPGVCDRCASRVNRERAADMASDALATMPARFRWATFEAQDLSARCPQDAIEKARKAARLLAGGNTRIVVLAGRAGSGKTSLACAIMRDLLHEDVGRTARFVGALTLSRARADAGLGRTPAIVEDAIRASLLLLDDLGQEAGIDVVREVIHARHDADAPMVITTGFHPKTFDDRYGAGTARRLTEHAKVIGVARGEH